MRYVHKMSSKVKKRLHRLISCVKVNDVEKLKYYLKRKKYIKLHLDETAVNGRKETLLHLACRLCKPEIVTCLFKKSFGDATSVDSGGNTALHLALKAIMKIDSRTEYISAYRSLILANLKEMSESLEQSNHSGQSGKDLLDLADSVYQYHLGGRSRTVPSKHKEDLEWQAKLEAEMDDEYGGSWGKYEEDFVQENVNEPETYDEWAERITREHKNRKFKSSPPAIPPPAQSKQSSSWTPEDQHNFLREEEKRKNSRKLAETAEKHLLFLSKLSKMAQSESVIGPSELPFNCTDDNGEISQLLLFHVKCLDDMDAKKKALRELQRLWHPDKFSQKFGARLREDIHEIVLRKVTEISQYINTFNCDSLAGK